jgi:N-acetylglucosamine kinase-like BadF-type ATPase
LFIGIDGGGTRARAVLVDAAGAVRARMVGDAGIIEADDALRGADASARLVRAMAQQAHVALPVTALCCGLAGAGREVERHAVRTALEQAGLAGRVVIVGDAEAAMADAFADAPGVLVIAGTGSIAWARGEDGAVHRAGGWGRLIGDEGSGFDIGVSAVRAVLRAWDGRDGPTTITPPLVEALGAAPPDLVRFIAGASKRQVAALAPIVLRSAAAGDPAAAAIRDGAVAALVELATTAARKAGLGAAPSVALAGGLIEPGGPLREDLAAALRVALPEMVLTTRSIDAALGAARIAAAAQ